MRFFLTLLLFVAACATPAKVDEKISNAVAIEMADGTVIPNGSIIKLYIYDGGLMDTAMVPTYSREYAINTNNSVAFFQTMLIPKKAYEALSMPSFSLRLEKQGELIGINKSAIRLDLSQQIQFLKIDRVK